MQTAQPRGRRAGKASRLGLALAGGGPLGATYEIGALLALTDALEGVDFNKLDVYVGVSSGSLVAAGLANGFTPGELYRIFIDNASSEHPLSPEIFLKPAFREYYRRAMSVPQLLVDSLWQYARDPFDARLIETFQRLGRAMPTGLFDNQAIADALHDLFTRAGCTDDFRKLKHRLFVVATDLDTGESVKFGAKGYDHVPISRALQASSALPGLFPPVMIDQRYYVDGALKKTLHASVALRDGANLVFCINPLVPFDARFALRKGRSPHKLVEGGLPVVLSQTFRALIHSRMQVGMAAYDTAYKNADVVLFEPDADDARMFFTNVFSYANRRRVCDHAYQGTLRELARRRATLVPVFQRHGIGLRTAALSTKAHVASSPSLRAAPATKLKKRLQQSLSELQTWLVSQDQRVHQTSARAVHLSHPA
jgi:NTE family protein